MQFERKYLEDLSPHMKTLNPLWTFWSRRILIGISSIANLDSMVPHSMETVCSDLSFVSAICR